MERFIGRLRDRRHWKIHRCPTGDSNTLHTLFSTRVGVASIILRPPTPPPKPK